MSAQSFIVNAAHFPNHDQRCKLRKWGRFKPSTEPYRAKDDAFVVVLNTNCPLITLRVDLVGAVAALEYSYLACKSSIAHEGRLPEGENLVCANVSGIQNIVQPRTS